MLRLLLLQDLKPATDPLVMVVDLASPGTEVLPVDFGGEGFPADSAATRLRVRYLSAMRIFLILGALGATCWGVGRFVGFARHAQNIRYAHNYCQAQIAQLFMAKPTNYTTPPDLIEFIEEVSSGIKTQILISGALRNLRDSFAGLSEVEKKARLWDLARQEKEIQEKVKKRSRG